MNKLKTGKKSATVIIGSGFGDEGKGLMTDRMAAPFGVDCIVARFNGGAQAGHTVVLPDGTRHIHSHLASGTLAGAATFLSKYFVSNPLLYHREVLELKNKGISAPVVFADRRGLVTTPYDMLLNQFAEQARGAHKHGSCGIGFGETVDRCEISGFSTTIADLADPKKLAAKLDKIRDEWIPKRLDKLGIKTISAEQQDILNAAGLKNDFIESATRFFEEIRLAHPNILRGAAKTVFEGAQGLLLDQDAGWFPYVTRSNTGLQNAVILAEEAGIDSLETIYTTRCYATRHGAGPFPTELPAPPFKGIYDETNVQNPYQDKLRFGWLDLDLLGRSIEHDFQLSAVNRAVRIDRHLAITCLDQLDDKTAAFVRNGKLCRSSINDFITQTSRAAKARRIYLSSGPTRETISERYIKKSAVSTVLCAV